MAKHSVRSESAPAPVGPYSQAVETGGVVYCAGQLGFDPMTGKLAIGGIESETRQVMENLGAVLAAAGCTFADVVKTTIYLTDMSNFVKVNGIYGEYFTDVPPARATVGVAALPAGAGVEVECIAVKP